MHKFHSFLFAICLGFGLNLAAQTYEFDGAGRLVRASYPDGNAIEYVYDEFDNLLSSTPTFTLPAVSDFIVVQRPTTIDIQGISVYWEYDGSKGGDHFLLQSRIVGASDWEDFQSIPIDQRTVIGSFASGEVREFRMLVYGATDADRSPPTEAVLVQPTSTLVTTLLDEDDRKLGEGQGNSLREAIFVTRAGGSITFASNLNGGTINLTLGQLIIEKKLTISAGSLPSGIIIDAGKQSRVFSVQTASAVILDKLTIAGGQSSKGGGVLNTGAALTIKYCTLQNNVATIYGGAISNETGGHLFLEHSEVRSNEAAYGGGLYNSTGSIAEILISRFTDNIAKTNGGGIYNVGDFLRLEKTSLISNGAHGFGGLCNNNSVAELENCTISGNGATYGAGVTNAGDGQLVIRHCTITENVSGGIYNYSPATLLLENSIVANNYNASNNPLDITGNIETAGANIVRNLVGGVTGPSVLNVDPLLSSLRGDGTHTPLPGSPAIDTAVATADSPGSDQLNQLRPFAGGSEIGSIESRLNGDTTLDWITASAGPLSPRFDTDVLNYTIIVPDSVTEVAVRALKGDNRQTLETRGNGSAYTVLNSEVASPFYPLNLGANIIELDVTAESGESQTYTLIIFRGLELGNSAELASLNLDELSPDFSPDVTVYHSPVTQAQTNVSLTATPKNALATMEYRVNFGAYAALTSGVSSPLIPVHEGSNTIDVRVTAVSGNSAMVYTIIVDRDSSAQANANLASLTTSVGSLAPDFSRGRLVYTMRLSGQTSSLQVTPTVASAGATLRIRANGGTYTNTASGSASTAIALQDGRNRIDIEVTAPDSVTVKTYSILIDRVVQRIVSVPADGLDLSLSADGRLLAFSSMDSDLVPDDTNNQRDIFVYDLVAETMRRVSVNVSGVQGNFDSAHPSISADGRFVAFHSEARNLVPNDFNGNTDKDQGRDIFVYDLANSTIERVSLKYDGGETNQHSDNPSISGDGRYVTFSSSASNLVENFRDGQGSVYVYDRELDETVGVAIPFADNQTNRYALNPVISADGQYVAFEYSVKSTSSQNGVRYGFQDIYLFNREDRSVERISGTKLGIEADGTEASNPAISADGRFVVFDAKHKDIDFYDTNVKEDVFIYDRQTGVTERVSTAYDQVDDPFRESIIPAISGDGQFVVFESRSAKLVPNDTNATTDIFQADRWSGDLFRVSVNEAGEEGGGPATNATISQDGLTVAFRTGSSNMVPVVTGELYAVITEPLPDSTVSDLLALTSTLGALDQPFSPDRTSYSVEVPDAILSGRLGLIAVDPDATIQASTNGSTFQSIGSDGVFLFDLKAGVNALQIRVTAADGVTQKIYTLDIVRPAPPYVPSSNALLASLGISAGVLSPAFSSEVVEYEVVVNADISSVQVTPTTQDTHATLALDGDAMASGTASASIDLLIGNNPIVCLVTAENGVSQKSYAINVNRVPLPYHGLTNLSINAGELLPDFSTDNDYYEILVPNNTETVSFTPALANSGDRVTINGEEVSSGEPSPAIDISDRFITSVLVVASSSDGTESSTYSVTIYRQLTLSISSNANLASLTLSDGVLTPNFDESSQLYRSEVGHSVTTITINPVLADNAASLLINGATATSGSASGPLTLNIGLNPIVLTVVAEDGIEKTYTVQVERTAFFISDITLVNPDQTVMDLTWQSEPGKNYILESSPDLKEWTQLGGTHPSTGTSTTVTIDLVAAGLTGDVFLQVIRVN